MSVSDDDLRAWLGNNYELAPDTTVSEQSWQDARWRAEYLCQRARLGLYHVHDELSGSRVVKFAQRKL
jgi:hypothetical protein